jgi:hypothetical protein
MSRRDNDRKRQRTLKDLREMTQQETLERLTSRRDALIAAARAIPVDVLDTEADPVLRSKKRELLVEAGKLFLEIQRLERKHV